MEKQQIQGKKKYIWVASGFLLAVVCFIALVFQVWLDRNKEVSLQVNTENKLSQDVSVWVEVKLLPQPCMKAVLTQ